MIRTCDGTDIFLTGQDGEPCRCGKTFDDVDHLVIYPHTKIVKARTDDPLIRLMLGLEES